jgi:hypothetical protein
MLHACEREEVHSGLWWGNLRVRNKADDLGVDERIILHFYF